MGAETAFDGVSSANEGFAALCEMWYNQNCYTGLRQERRDVIGSNRIKDRKTSASAGVGIETQGRADGLILRGIR